jgi:DNA polymerase bacteriophage-type
MMKLHHDIETRSPVNLKTAGVYVYAEDPLTEVLMMSWAIDDDPVECWRIWRREPMPARLREAFLDPETVLCAHNVDFERTLAVTSALRNQDYLPPDITKAIVSHDRWSCTAARAAAVGLPRTLDGVCKALGLSVQKDMEGYKIMMRTCKPKALGLDGKWVYHESDALFEREAQYCNRDVESERAVDYSIPELSTFEREVWKTTGRMNDRGIMVDQKLLVQMSLFVADAETDLNKRLRKVTDNMVPRVSDHMALRKWLVSQGFPDIEDEGVGKAVITALLEAEDLSDFIREVLIMRQQGGKSSTAKYRALVQRLNRDSRIRGAIVYCGAASTGRYSSRGAQLQNLPRGGTVKTILQAVEDILNGMPLPLVEMMHGPALIVASEIVRPTFIAPDGYWLARGDYGQIEDRVNNWFSGQEEQLDAFRAYDSGTGPDPYRVTAGQIFSKSPDKISSLERQGGKVIRLAGGFQGSKKAALAYAKLYGVKMTEELAEELIAKFRENNPGIVKFWYKLDDAAMECVSGPKGVRHIVRPGLWFTRTDRVLAMRLPSGRSLLYWYPKLEEVTVPWGRRISVTFWAEDSQTKQWKRHNAYGGLFCENAVQATARDLMAYSLVRLDRDGMAPCLTVHDEAICQLSREMFPTPHEAAQAVKIRMLDSPSYLAGLPIAVDASAGPRYAKA